MLMLIATLLISLLCSWPLDSATSQPRGQGNPALYKSPNSRQMRLNRPRRV
jgi:hypothetical protein